MTDGEQRILGRLETASCLHGKKLDQIVSGMEADRKVNGATRDMVLKHDNGIRLGRWVILAVIAAVSALGLDRWRG